MIKFIELSSSSTENERNGIIPGKGEIYNIGYIWTIIIIIILIVTLIVHLSLKHKWRQVLKDKLLEDEQQIKEYEKIKIQNELEMLKEENKKLKQNKN